MPITIGGPGIPQPTPTGPTGPPPFAPVSIPNVSLPHLQAPPILQGDGTFSFWQQDTIAEVAQSVEMVCGTIAGQRTVVPAFGLPIEAFVSPNPNLAQMQQDIKQWEPRATTELSVINNPPGVAQVSVAVALAGAGGLGVTT
jgi:hypothetical protein